MATFTMSQSLTHLRQALHRYAGWFCLCLALVTTAFAAYRAVSMPATPISITRKTPQTVWQNPAQQAVRDYLRAHSSDQPTQAHATPLDPAQQSVMNYVHAHNRVDPPPAFWDQAVQAVRDYLRAHSR